MAKTRRGSIVKISSIMGFVGSISGHPAYHASEGAVQIYSKPGAVRYRPSGVRVNTAHPCYMPLMLNATNAGERADRIAMTPLRRIGKPIEGRITRDHEQGTIVREGGYDVLCDSVGEVPLLRIAAHIGER
jgi:NAD(P)-dependent dehydrogenase (short-subunit alcohol dehydrogenase family)